MLARTISFGTKDQEQLGNGTMNYAILIKQKDGRQGGGGGGGMFLWNHATTRFDAIQKLNGFRFSPFHERIPWAGFFFLTIDLIKILSFSM